MPKIDSIKEKINILRDDYRHLFIFFMTVLAGSFAIFFQIILHKLTIVYACFAIIGIVICLFVLIEMKKIKYDIDKLINELEEI